MKKKQKNNLIKKHYLLSSLMLFCLVAIAGYSSYQLFSENFFIEKVYNDTEVLTSLGYIDFVPQTPAELKQSGVILNDNSAIPGINIFFSTVSENIRFLANDGKILHVIPYDKRISLFKIYNNDSILMLNKDNAIGLYSKNMTEIWELNGLFHHKFKIYKDGNIYAINSNMTINEKISKKQIKDELITIINSQGGVIKEYSIANIFVKLENYSQYLNPKNMVDVFHLNSLDIVEEDIFVNGKKMLSKGNVVVCSKVLSIIFAIDLDKEEIIWIWGKNEIYGAHDIQILNNRYFLIFDNGEPRKYSRIIEYDIFNDNISYEYTSTPKEKFYSKVRGGVQKLDNGHYLISESNKGYVFEIDENKKTVWEFLSPDTNKESRASIYKVNRLIGKEAKDFMLMYNIT